MNEFRATHEITLLDADGTARSFEVQLAQGRAHTLAEWLRHAQSSWSFRDGQWWFHKRAAPPGCVTLAVVSIVRAALERLAWELVDSSRGIVYDGHRLVFERSGSPAILRLDMVEDHLRLTDGESALHVDARASASWVRELVEEWPGDARSHRPLMHR